VSVPLPQDACLAELDQASCRAGSERILGPVACRIERGECVGVIGPNGAGKSTLLGLMNATVRPSSGQVRVFGADPWTLPESGRCRLRGRVATDLQRNDYNPIAPLPARDVGAMGRLGFGGLFGRISVADWARIDGTLEQFGIAHLARRAYRNLSGGEQQKVQIARALVQDPEFLLLDEPTTGLDIDWQERLVGLIDELGQNRQLTILMTTHAIHHLPQSCRRVILLREGRVLFDGDTASALTPRHMGEVYACPVDIIERNGRRYCLGMREGQ
jgi:ABC-type cobalamin/Fe3+-siderophores transport system ATPase subunit